MRTQVCVIGLVAVVVNPCVAQSPSVVRHRFAARHPPAVRTLAVILAAAHGYSIGSEHEELLDVAVVLDVRRRPVVVAHLVAATKWQMPRESFRAHFPK